MPSMHDVANDGILSERYCQLENSHLHFYQLSKSEDQCGVSSRIVASVLVPRFLRRLGAITHPMPARVYESYYQL